VGRLSILPGIQVSPYSITRDLYLIYLYTLRYPTNQCTPDRKFIRGLITPRTLHAGETGIVRGKGDTSDTNNPRYAQAETGLNYTNLSYKLIQTYIQTSHGESKEIEQVS
jgi:hypothetical protein